MAPYMAQFNTALDNPPRLPRPKNIYLLEANATIIFFKAAIKYHITSK